MVALAGGIIALILGFVGLIKWFDAFLWLLKGVVPLVFIMGGALAAYLGAEELKDKKRAEMEKAQSAFAPGVENVEQYKAEINELKAKLAELEKEKTAPTS